MELHKIWGAENLDLLLLNAIANTSYGPRADWGNSLDYEADGNDRPQPAKFLGVL